MPKIYSTARVPRGARLKYWNELHSNLLGPIEIKPFDRAQFDATSRLEHLGQLRMVMTESAPAIVEHGAHHVAQTKERRFRVLLSAQGRLRLQHFGHEGALEEGDFALLDDAAPYRIAFREPNNAIWLAVTPSTLRTFLPTPSGLCGIAMSASAPMNNVVSNMLRGLCNQVQQGLPTEQGEVLARNLLQVMASAYSLEHGCREERSVVASARCTEIKQYIEMHLRNPELGPTPIANALGVSRRYVRLLFATESDSVTAYIRRRRLEECAWELAQPLWQGRSITATASDWGFRSMAHFTRAFKEHYGSTPTAFRRAKLQPLHTEPLRSSSQAQSALNA
jgi:AraC family transcriptional activator of tynA and feaB